MNELVNHPEWMPLLLDENGEATFGDADNLHLRCSYVRLAGTHTNIAPKHIASSVRRGREIPLADAISRAVLPNMLQPALLRGLVHHGREAASPTFDPKVVSNMLRPRHLSL